jgi:hypothetical protein
LLEVYQELDTFTMIAKELTIWLLQPRVPGWAKGVPNWVCVALNTLLLLATAHWFWVPYFQAQFFQKIALDLSVSL